MSSISLDAMRVYLGRSIAGLNQNKLRGLLAEIELREYLRGLGFADRVSPGGWVVRSSGPGHFGTNTAVIFPETIEPNQQYFAGRPLSQPSHGLHSICVSFHQSGIAAFFCAATIARQNDTSGISWNAVQLGLPAQQPYGAFPAAIAGFNPRQRRYNFLRYRTDASTIPERAVPEEFSKEHLRVSFQDIYMCEISDVDGIFYGRQIAYPVEIKEKTVAHSNKVGEFFGLDLGPFVKLAFYAAKRGNLHSIFIVREIDSPENRQLIQWWFITFDRLAQFASWIPLGGGANMMGGASTVVQIPKSEFRSLTTEALNEL